MNPVETIKQAMTYIDAHLDEDLNCLIVARKFHYSAYHFHRLFQYVTNVSVTDYIRNRRLNAIANDLLTAHDTILRICFRYGFNNQRTFHRAFKSRFGITPTEFKQQNIPVVGESPDFILSNFYKRSVNDSWTAAQQVLPIALQVYSVRMEAEDDFRGTMEKVKLMGYNNVELCLYNEIPARDIRETLDELNLQAISAHVFFEDLCANTDEIINTCRTIGCKYVVIPYLGQASQPGGPKYPMTLSSICEIGSVCADNGMILLYHNHGDDFNLMPDGRYRLDHLYGDIPADLLQAQLDTGWVKAAGLNPVDFIEKYAMRVPLIHLKDFRMKGSNIDFMPIGHGVQDIPAILTAAVASGVEWIIVEQDDSIVETPLLAVQKSREYLHKLGW